MVYLFLVLSAVIFALLGFLLHVFYFSGPRDAVQLKEIEALKKMLDEKHKEAQEAQEETVKTSTMVHSLEEQIRRRNERMESLQRMVARQDDEIRQLQKEAVALQAALGRAEKPLAAATAFAYDVNEPVAGISSVGLEPAKEIASEPSRGEKEAAGRKEGAVPPWKDNLNNILNIIDSMEKEIDK